MRLQWFIGVVLGMLVVTCAGEFTDIDIDVPVDDMEENDNYVEDMLKHDPDEFEGGGVKFEQVGESEEFEDAPQGDETGDLSKKEMDEILEDDDGADIIRDEDHVVKAVKEELDEDDFTEDELEDLEEALEAAADAEKKADDQDFIPDDSDAGQRVYKDIESARKAIYDRDKYDDEFNDFNDDLRYHVDVNQWLRPDDGDPEMRDDPNAEANRRNPKRVNMFEKDRMTDEELAVYREDDDDGGPEEKPDAEKTERDRKLEADMRVKQRKIRRIARLREMQKNTTFNGTLDITQGERVDHDPEAYKRLRKTANDILKKQRQRKKYSRGKHKLTATVKIDPMVTIKGGKFKMGTNDPTSETGEYPVRNMAVKPYKIDRYPVTNGDYSIFKRKKFRYRTDAEKRGFSWVFYLNMGKNATRDQHRTLAGEPWWFAVKDATYDHPGGFGTTILDKPDHPAVHVSYHDAAAFCLWAGKRLATEYEWEYASRGGKNGIRYPWGDKFERNRTNLWQGLFPMENKKADGYVGLSPVNAYKPQNEYGLYDMVGNVWEWTSSPWSMPRRRRNEPLHEEDPDAPKRHVVRGGSFIDSRDGSINYEARCGNRKPMPVDFTIENVGFRCAQTIKMEPRRAKKEATTTTTPAPKRRPPKVHRLKDTWSYKMKAMLEDIIHGGKESASAVMEKLKQMRKKEEL